MLLDRTMTENLHIICLLGLIMFIVVPNKVNIITYFWSLFWWTLKWESAWDHIIVNTKFNVFYSTFTEVFFKKNTFYVFNVFNFVFNLL